MESKELSPAERVLRAMNELDEDDFERLRDTLAAQSSPVGNEVKVDWTAAAVDRELPEAVLAMGGAPIVPVGEVGLLAGFSGTGKSRLVAQIAAAAAGTEDGELAPVLHSCAVSAGRPGLGDALRVRGGPVVLVGYEDAAPWVRWRTAGAARWLDGGGRGACSRAVDEPERLSAAVLETPLFAPPGREADATPTTAWRAVFDRASEIGARLVVVDPISLAWDAGVDGYSAGPVNRCIVALRAEAARLQAAILLVAHLPKAARMKRTADAGDVSGSAAWVDRVRGLLVLTRRDDEVSKDGGEQAPPWLGVAKANYCRSGDGVGWPLAPVMDGGRPLAWEAEDGEAQDGGVVGGVVPVTVA